MEKILLQGEIPVNCYAVAKNKECYLVDPGYEKEKVTAWVGAREWRVMGILLTHGHIDHIGAIDSFDVPVYIHRDELEIIQDNYNNGFTYYGREVPYDLRSINLVPFNNGTTFRLGDGYIESIHVPGHTPGCVCYRYGMDLYTGDTLFAGSVGRWDFPLGNLNSLMKSIVHLVDNMPGSMRIHPAHGESSTIAFERSTNDYYRMWKKELSRN